MNKLFAKNIRKLIPVVLAVVSGLCPLAAQTPTSQTETRQNKETREQALQMVKAPEPKFRPYNSNEGVTAVPVAPAESGARKFKMKDGKYLSASHFVKKGSTITIVLLHGVLSSAFRMNTPAAMLRDSADADVLAIDLRGHGKSEGTPGDVDRIDQYAKDVAEVVEQVRKERPKTKIILAGHSMGGGIALRYAMLKDHPPVNGYLLFAPLLGQNAPTLPQPTAAKPNSNEEPFLKIHIERLIGLKMLNSIGDHQYDNLNVLFFNVPPSAPIKAYSYRANESMAPVDYAQGLRAVRKPLLVLVGSKDEAFVASAFEKAVTTNSKGDVFVVENTTHNEIIMHSSSMKLIRDWAVTKVANLTQRS